MQELSFRSPLRKLVVFFHASRDRWKLKCQDAKHELKLLKRRYTTLQKSSACWHQRYLESEAQREQLQRQVDALSKQRITLG